MLQAFKMMRELAILLAALCAVYGDSATYGMHLDRHVVPANYTGIPGVDPEANMKFCQISVYHGYACEEYLHEVVTKDGFLLTMHRITGRKKKLISDRRPVFLQHGLLCDSTSWILNLPNQTLPFLIADAGFDVWLANSRGNTYSMAHQTLKPHQEEFWAWSWDEMAMYDLPASVDFVLNKTGHNKLHYVGYSQGTLIGFVHLGNTRNDKFVEMIALAPVFQLAHMEGILSILSPAAKDIYFVLKLLGIHDFLPNLEVIKILGDTVCNENDPVHEICGYILQSFAGIDTKQFNESRLPVYLGHAPAGTSVRNMMHFVQMYDSKVCSRYDYGSPAKNVLHYGTPVPPAYNLSAITHTPVSLYYGGHDWLADPKDVNYILSHLKTIQRSEYIPGWDHLDFLWAMDATSKLYNSVIEELLLNP
ncbi:gastric triacylglycerol lipase-like [Watersipora subatra]|uniref:gastric triacylglycerol lipase-like n=1 Tax=Watersipora subatra TaxID=2589382 RepID=UPI00355B7EBE